MRDAAYQKPTPDTRRCLHRNATHPLARPLVSHGLGVTDSFRTPAMDAMDGRTHARTHAHTQPCAAPRVPGCFLQKSLSDEHRANGPLGSGSHTHATHTQRTSHVQYAAQPSPPGGTVRGPSSLRLLNSLDTGPHACYAWHAWAGLDAPGMESKTERMNG